MATTKTTAAKDVTNTANGSLAIAEDLFPKANQRLTGAGDVATSRGTADYGGASNAYSDMATTGGFSSGDENAYLNRATEGVKNTYDVLGQQSRQAGMRTGASNAPAVYSQMARQGVQAQEQALNDAQVGLHTQENQNKLAGAGGLGNLYNTNSTNENTANQQYLTGTNNYLSTLNNINQTKQAAISGYAAPIADQILGPVSQVAGIAKNFV